MRNRTPEDLLSLYRDLLLARISEEKIRQEYFKDEMKTPVHLGVGGEAIAAGVYRCLPKGTKTFGTYRNHTLYLCATGDTDSFFGEMYGKLNGAGKGKAGSMHLMAPEQGLMATSAVVGTTIPLAVGAAFANAYRELPDCVAVFFGDGAVEEGVFWESLNFACLRHLRVLFVCEDNDLAIHTSRSDRRGFASLADTVRTFDCYVQNGDGADVLNVMDKTRWTLEQMSLNPKPGLLHFSYHRFFGHVGPIEDYDAGYRPRPSKEELETLDPVANFEKRLLRGGFIQKQLDDIRASIQDQVDKSALRAQSAPFPPASELYEDVFA